MGKLVVVSESDPQFQNPPTLSLSTYAPVVLLEVTQPLLFSCLADLAISVVILYLAYFPI